MAKNYKAIYTSGNSSIALEQKCFIKKETVKGVFTAPTNNDFLYTLGGFGIKHTQAINPSPTRSGRHNISFIKEKKVADFSLPSFFNIDTQVAAGVTEIDLGLQVLLESLLGRKTISSGVIFDSANTPSTTFTMLEVGDLWSKQMVGAYVNDGEFDFPGDGQAKISLTGAGKEAIVVGISRSAVANAGGTTVTLATVGEAIRFPVGSYVQIVKNDGVTRSTDTPSGSPRLVTASDTSTGIVTLNGANLTTDSDGTGLLPVFLTYYEPEAPVAINNPITGLIGSVTVSNLTTTCVRMAKLSLKNNHESVNYCFGSDSLQAPFFVAGGRLQAELTLEINFDASVLEFYNKVRKFESSAVTLNLGDTGSRYAQVTIPKVQFNIPEITIPETGSIPVTFTGICYETAIDSADEVTLSFL